VNEEDVLKLCDVIRQTSYDIHVYLKNGHLEKIYENALVHRLRKFGIDVRQQHDLRVYDEDGTLLGKFTADLFIEGVLIVELKACKSIAQEHIAQIFGYLRASRIEHGLLINFGGSKVEIKKFILSTGR
jgi:GxxExxY protein